MSTTIAKELRAAATRLRERASAASPGPWQSYSGRIDSPNGTVAVALNGHSDSEWIALVNPLLAEPFAAVLEQLAVVAARAREGSKIDAVEAALVIARQINGTTPVPLPLGEKA